MCQALPCAYIIIFITCVWPSLHYWVPPGSCTQWPNRTCYVQPSHVLWPSLFICCHTCSTTNLHAPLWKSQIALFNMLHHLTSEINYPSYFVSLIRFNLPNWHFFHTSSPSSSPLLFSVTPSPFHSRLSWKQLINIYCSTCPSNRNFSAPTGLILRFLWPLFEIICSSVFKFTFKFTLSYFDVVSFNLNFVLSPFELSLNVNNPPFLCSPLLPSSPFHQGRN